jgi:hypothetical protein
VAISGHQPNTSIFISIFIDIHSGTNRRENKKNFRPIHLNYFSANEQCFPPTTNQYKYQHKPNFNISEQGVTNRREKKKLTFRAQIEEKTNKKN